MQVKTWPYMRETTACIVESTNAYWLCPNTSCWLVHCCHLVKCRPKLVHTKAVKHEDFTVFTIKHGLKSLVAFMKWLVFNKNDEGHTFSLKHDFIKHSHAVTSFHYTVCCLLVPICWEYVLYSVKRWWSMFFRYAGVEYEHIPRRLSSVILLLFFHCAVRFLHFFPPNIFGSSSTPVALWDSKVFTVCTLQKLVIVCPLLHEYCDSMFLSRV